jgi:hypothetical protein
MPHLLKMIDWYRKPWTEQAKDWAMRPRHQSSLMETLAYSVVAGIAGNVALNLSNTLEQWVTQRPNSYVPGHTFERLTGMQQRPDSRSNGTNHAFQLGVATLAGVARGLMARRGMRGPYAYGMHMAARVLLDQSLEHAVGMSRPPWTWPKDEQALDMLHKGAYALVSGLLIERWVQSDRPAASNRQ